MELYIQFAHRRFFTSDKKIIKLRNLLLILLALYYSIVLFTRDSKRCLVYIVDDILQVTNFCQICYFCNTTVTRRQNVRDKI